MSNIGIWQGCPFTPYTFYLHQHQSCSVGYDFPNSVKNLCVAGVCTLACHVSRKSIKYNNPTQNNAHLCTPLKWLNCVNPTQKSQCPWAHIIISAVQLLLYIKQQQEHLCLMRKCRHCPWTNRVRMHRLVRSLAMHQRLICIHSSGQTGNICWKLSVHRVCYDGAHPLGDTDSDWKTNDLYSGHL